MKMFRTAVLLPAIAVAGAIGFALPASVAVASQGDKTQSEKTQGDAAASKSKPASVGGVVVQGSRRRLNTVPPDKAAAFDDEVAKSESWKRYRKSTPPASASTLEQGKDYPGAQNLLPH